MSTFDRGETQGNLKKREETMERERNIYRNVKSIFETSSIPSILFFFKLGN